MSRNYKKEYETYHSRPEQKIRRAARNAARAKFKDADPNKDVHHKDNNPLNNDKNNLSLVTQHYNRREPRLREEAKDVKKLLSKVKGLSKQQAVLLSQLPLPVLTAIVTQLSHLTMGEEVNEKSGHTSAELPPKGFSHPYAKKLTSLMSHYFKTKNPRLKIALLRDINKLQLKLGLKQTEDIQIEDMGTVTGPHIAGTGDDSSTVKVRKKKKVRRRKDESLRSKKKCTVND